jgi:hypothetical protein
LPDCQIARLPDHMFKAWGWFVVHSSGQSVCWKNWVSSKLFNIWTRNKNNSPSDDVLEQQIVPQCFVVLFEISIWKAFLVMVCSPVKLSSSASLRNRVVIPGNDSKFEKFPNAEWVWDFHFIFQVHFVIWSCAYPRMNYLSAILC